MEHHWMGPGAPKNWLSGPEEALGGPEGCPMWRRASATLLGPKALALDHITELEIRAAELRQLIMTLRHLADACDGGDYPDCPIIKELEIRLCRMRRQTAASPAPAPYHNYREWRLNPDRSDLNRRSNGNPAGKPY